MFGKKKKLEAERREEELRLQKQELERQQAQAAQGAEAQDAGYDQGANTGNNDDPDGIDFANQ